MYNQVWNNEWVNEGLFIYIINTYIQNLVNYAFCNELQLIMNKITIFYVIIYNGCAI